MRHAGLMTVNLLICLYWASVRLLIQYGETVFYMLVHGIFVLMHRDVILPSVFVIINLNNVIWFCFKHLFINLFLIRFLNGKFLLSTNSSWSTLVNTSLNHFHEKRRLLIFGILLSMNKLGCCGIVYRYQLKIHFCRYYSTPPY